MPNSKNGRAQDMATECFEFQVELRKNTGKRAARHIRRFHNKIPGVVYGAGKAPQSINLVQKDILKALENEATFSSILILKIGDKKQKVILKDLQRHQTKPAILHIDFQRTQASEKLTMHVPLHFISKEECLGVESGGIVSHLQTNVEIRCFPSDLPEYIEVDISKLGLDKSLHLSDLKLPSGVELATAIEDENDLPIVNIHLPRVSKADIEAEDANSNITAKVTEEVISEDPEEK